MDSIITTCAVIVSAYALACAAYYLALIASGNDEFDESALKSVSFRAACVGVGLITIAALSQILLLLSQDMHYSPGVVYLGAVMPGLFSMLLLPRLAALANSKHRAERLQRMLESVEEMSNGDCDFDQHDMGIENFVDVYVFPRRQGPDDFDRFMRIYRNLENAGLLGADEEEADGEGNGQL